MCEGELKNERVQESSEKITGQMQQSIQNVTPAVARNVQVLGVLAVNSSDEFQMKFQKTTAKNISAKDKNTRSPVKSPEKDDDVSYDQSEQNYSRHFA